MSKITPVLYFINLLIFWVLISYLCFNMTLGTFTIILIFAAGIFAFIRTLFTSIMLPSLMNALKRTAEIKERKENNKDSFSQLFKELAEENKKMKKRVAQTIFMAFFPALFSVIFLWWAFYRIVSAMNVSTEFILYVIFVIVFEIIISNFSKNLKKLLINESIDKSHE